MLIPLLIPVLILDKVIEDINNSECYSFDNVAPNVEHVNQQDCAVESHPGVAFRSFCFKMAMSSLESFFFLQ